MTNRIVLSYRRSDSEVITGRIRDKLAGHYGEDAVFLDIDAIPLGVDFRRQIKEALLDNKIFIAVIGPRWLGGTGTDARINEENDPVRIEVETALQQGTPVIPVLVSGATMPKPSELPPSLKNLCYLNAAEVDGGRDFHQHVDRLIQAIDRILKASEAPPAERTIPAAAPSVPRTGQAPTATRKWILLPVGVIAGLIVVVLGIWAYSPTSSYLKSKLQTKVAVQPTTAPAPTPAPAVLAPPPFASAGCKPETASFYDNFHKPDPGWNLPSADQNLVHYADGQLVVTAPPNRAQVAQYLSLRYQNATICAHIKSPPVTAENRPSAGLVAAGLIFWAVDYADCYAAVIGADGTYGIFRKVAGNWRPVVPFTKNEQVKTGGNVVNEVTVTLVDDFGALFINNVKVKEFRGQAPTVGGAVGLYASSKSTGPDEWRFLDLAVMDNGKSKPVTLPPAPSGPAISDCQPANPTDFQDTFANADPAWDAAGDFVDGQLSLKPNETKYLIRLYPLVFNNATMCLTLKFPSEAGEETNGGLVFWASDFRNFYEASIYPEGTFRVVRKINDEWVVVVPTSASDTIKKGVDAVNKLQVVSNNGKVVLYINGVEVSEFRGQPPPRGGMIGVYGGSAKNQRNEWRFLNITVVEDQ